MSCDSPREPPQDPAILNYYSNKPDFVLLRSSHSFKLISYKLKNGPQINGLSSAPSAQFHHHPRVDIELNCSQFSG